MAIFRNQNVKYSRRFFWALLRPLDCESADCVGAVALCWLDTDTLDEAEENAVDQLLAEGWHPLSLEEYRLVTADSEEYGRGNYSDKEIDEIFGNVAIAQRDEFYVRFYACSSDASEH